MRGLPICIGAFGASNNIANGAAPEAFNINGSYSSVFKIGYRPAYNGALLYVQGGEPVSANAKPYYILKTIYREAGGFDSVRLREASRLASCYRAINYSDCFGELVCIGNDDWRDFPPACRMEQTAQQGMGVGQRCNKCSHGNVAELADAVGDQRYNDTKPRCGGQRNSECGISKQCDNHQWSELRAGVLMQCKRLRRRK